MSLFFDVTILHLQFHPNYIIKEVDKIYYYSGVMLV